MAADQDLKQSWAASMAEPVTAHLTDEMWALLCSGEMQGSARAEAFEHVTECAQCSTTYRELAHVQEQARAFDPGAPAVSKGTSRVPLWGWMGAAAAALLAALVGVSGLRTVGPVPQPSPTDVLRSGDGSVPLPQAPRGTLTESPTAFRWDPVPGLAAYHVELLSVAGKKLWSSADVASSSVAWPGDLQLEPGRYYWRVVAKPTPTSPAADSVTSPLVQIDLPASNRR